MSALNKLVLIVKHLFWSFMYNVFHCPQFSEIVDKISVYVGKQRKNSEGECHTYHTGLLIFDIPVRCLPENVNK